METIWREKINLQVLQSSDNFSYRDEFIITGYFAEIISNEQKIKECENGRIYFCSKWSKEPKQRMYKREIISWGKKCEDVNDWTFIMLVLKRRCKLYQ